MYNPYFQANPYGKAITPLRLPQINQNLSLYQKYR